MSSEYSYIEAHDFYNQLGHKERTDYKWVGKSPKTWINRNLVMDPQNDILFVGPYRLKIIDESLYGNYECILLDYPLWWLLVFWHRVNRIFEIAYHRLIITLAIWRLAHYNPGVIPHWRDIYALEWLVKRIRH